MWSACGGERGRSNRVSLLDTLDPVLRPWAQRLYDVCLQARVNPRVTSAFRSYATQKSLYEAYLAGRSKYPAAPPGRSAHEYGLAFDMVVTGASNQVDCGIVWNSWGGDYGGEEDPIHFQYPGFTPPPNPPPPAGGGIDQTVLVYTPYTVEVAARQVADAILPRVLDMLGYSVDIRVLTSAIVALFGPPTPSTDWAQALRVLDWGGQHPAEFFGAESDLLRTIIASYF